MRISPILAAGLSCCAGASHAQIRPNLGAAGAIVTSARAGAPGGIVGVRQPIVASLSYDGTSTWGVAGQDFESVFDTYDTFVCEPFGVAGDVGVTEFRSAGFGTGNAFGVTDVRAEIHLTTREDDICDDAQVPSPFMVSVPGAGFWDGGGAVTDFGGKCLPLGRYILRWAVELNFTSFGQVFFHGQYGDHDNGLGEPNDAFQSNPLGGFGLSQCFRSCDQLCTGVNFVLCGGPADCEAPCPDPDGCGDWDGDGDGDADDFFLYLDFFGGGSGCADLDGDGGIDGDDLFGFLDRFITPC